MATSNIEMLREAYRAFAERDEETVLAVMSPDVEWDATDALAHTGLVHGHEGVLNYLRELHDVWDEFTLEPDQFIESPNGEDVMILGVTRGRLKATGESIEARFAHIGQVRNRKVLKIKICLDRASAERVLEQAFAT